MEPDKYADAWLDSPLSARWQRVVIQHAAGVAQSWRSNRDRAHQAYLDEIAEHQAQADSQRPAPTWKEWQTPTLKQMVIQANANVAALEGLLRTFLYITKMFATGLEPSEDSTFDYWLRISTLSRGSPICLPVKLSHYHRRMLDGKRWGTSMTLTRKPSGWWLTLTVDERVDQTTMDESPVVGWMSASRTS